MDKDKFIFLSVISFCIVIDAVLGYLLRHHVWEIIAIIGVLGGCTVFGLVMVVGDKKYREVI